MKQTWSVSIGLAFLVAGCGGAPTRTVIDDPRDNLQGDVSRQFMDIVQTSLETRDSDYVFTVVTAGPLPSLEEMVGGKRVDFIWGIDIDRDTSTGQSARGNDYNIHLWLGESGWHHSFYKVSELSKNDGIEHEKRTFKITADSNEASLAFPQTYLPADSFDWWLCAMTGNAPDWPPRTDNPHTVKATFGAPE